VLGGVSGALIGNGVGGLYEVASAASSISTAADHIESVTTGLFQGERHEASTLSEWDQRAEAAINVVSAREPRLLQCVVKPDRPSVTAGSANVLVSGRQRRRGVPGLSTARHAGWWTRGQRRARLYESRHVVRGG
jgi:hypothetical protein